MKKIFIILLSILSISLASTQFEVKQAEPQTIEKAQFSECEILLSQNATAEELKRRGCCSHHNGVCGCKNGRAVCCDNTLSPTCGCD